MIFASVAARGQTGAIQGHSFLGGVPATVQGAKSSNYLDGIVPSAIITVYLTGTQTKATIYSNSSGGALANPFTSNTLGSVNPGGYVFWAATNAGYDVVASGGICPNCYSTPVTLLVSAFAGGSGGGGGIGYPPAGIPNSTGSSWATSYGTTGTGPTVALANSPTLDNATLNGTTNFVTLQAGSTTISATAADIAGPVEAAGNIEAVAGGALFASNVSGSSPQCAHFVNPGTGPWELEGTGGDCGAGGSGTAVSVNGGSELGTVNLNGTTPTAPVGDTNVTWQISGSSVSAYVPTGITCSGTCTSGDLPIFTGSTTVANSLISYGTSGFGGGLSGFTINGTSGNDGGGWIQNFPAYTTAGTDWAWQLNIGPAPSCDTADANSYLAQIGETDGAPALFLCGEQGLIDRELSSNGPAAWFLSPNATNWNQDGSEILLSDGQASLYGQTVLGFSPNVGNSGSNFPGNVSFSWLGDSETPTQSSFYFVCTTAGKCYLPQVASTQSTAPICPNGDIWGALTTSGCAGGSSGPSDTTVAVSGATQSANSCSSTTNVTMTGLTTSMVLLAGYSGNPASLTGWGSSGGMVFQIWPSASNTATWQVCNQTTSSITFSSITFDVGAR